MKGFALSSEVPEAPITQEAAVALTKALRRVEAWWSAHPVLEWDNRVNVDLKWSPVTGAMLGDPEYCVVHVVASLPNVPKGDLAYHSTDSLGRPVCFISWEAVSANGGTLTGPNGLVAVISHEINECRVDPTCQVKVMNPGGLLEPKEVCDRLQGSDYEEPGSPGIFVANAAGPAFFQIKSTGPWDTASDVGKAAAKYAFDLLPHGYYETVDPKTGATDIVLGMLVTNATRDRILRQGPRGGLVRMRHQPPPPWSVKPIKDGITLTIRGLEGTVIVHDLTFKEGVELASDIARGLSTSRNVAIEDVAHEILWDTRVRTP